MEESVANLLLETGILSFSSFEDFNNSIVELSQMEDEELLTWEKENNPNSLLTTLSEKGFDSDSYLNNLPNSYKAIFNGNSQILVEDKVIYMDEEGKLYEFPKTSNLENLKTQIKAQEPLGSINVSYIALDKTTDGNASSRVTMGPNTLNAKYQFAFPGSYYKDCGSNTPRALGAEFKYVHELQTVETRLPLCIAGAQLFLRMKLEYRFRSNRPWQAAGEKRTINVNLNLNGVTLNNGTNIQLSGSDYVTGSYTCSGDKTILLKYTPNSYDTCLSYTANWSIATSGTLSQAMNGGYNPWSHSANW